MQEMEREGSAIEYKWTKSGRDSLYIRQRVRHLCCCGYSQTPVFSPSITERE